MRKYKSFTAILLTAALVSSVTACSQNTVTQPSVEVSSDQTESISGISSSGNNIETTEAEEAEKTMAASSEEETEESTAAAEVSGTEATAEEQSETEATREEASEALDQATAEGDSKETTTKVSENCPVSTGNENYETTKASETTKVPETTKAPETAKTMAAAKPQSITASVSGTHYVGDTLIGTDFTVTVAMSDGSTLTNPAGWSANPFTLSGTSNQITIAYEGVSTTITVKANERPTPTQPATTAQEPQPTATPTTPVPTISTPPTPPTQPATTPTPTEPQPDPNGIYIKEGEWSYELARLMFDIQNEYRAEAGVQPLTWNDEMYKTAMKCAKTFGDAGKIDHALTEPYLSCPGYVGYVENAAISSAPADIQDATLWATYMMEALKNSKHHYGWLKSKYMNYGAIAVYKKNGALYASCLFAEYEEDIFPEN